MFSPNIVDSDAFLDMPPTAQNLYFHLGMRADDDGFVGNPKKIMRMLNIGDDDMKILLAKRFVLTFESGVIVIKHWRINNLIRKDWYRETIYLDEKNKLEVKENGAYTEKENVVNGMLTSSLTQVRLGKDRLGKVIQGDDLPDWLDKEVWNNWVEYRKEKKQKLTQRSISMQLNELAKDQANHREILEQSIRNGWTGLFPLKSNNVQKVYKNTGQESMIDKLKAKTIK